MRTIIKKILKETTKKKTSEYLKSKGPLESSNMGLDLEDFVNLAYDGDIVQYVSEYLNELLHLTPKKEYETNAVVLFPIKDTEIFKEDTPIYSPSKEDNLLLLSSRSMQSIKEYMTTGMFVKFMNEFYNLDITKLFVKKFRY